MIKELILKHKFISAIFLTSLFFGGFAYFAISSNVVAMVNYRPIWKSDMDEVVGLMIKYYDSANKGSSTDISSSEFFKDKYLLKNVKKEALTRIVEYKILSMKLEKINPNWRKLAQSKIDNAFSKIGEKDKFEQGVKYLYGMNADDFKGKVLMPQAEFEILSDELKKQGLSYDDWMKSEKKGLKISVMVDGLEWKDGEVAIR